MHIDRCIALTSGRFHSFIGKLLQGACVQNVLDSVISALLDDKNRKFIYVEMVSSRCCSIDLSTTNSNST